MSQDAVARPDLGNGEFPVHDSREAGFNEPLHVVILPSRRGWLG